MSLKGNLESFSMPNILQMISLEKKTGLLQVDHGETSISIAFREGEVIFAERKSGKDFKRLQYTVIRNKMIAKERFVHAIKEHKATLKPVWTVLAKYASKKVLQEILERQIKDCLFLALQWESGLYQFDLTEELNVSEEIPVSIGIDFLLMEGCRVADEWKVLSKNFPADDAIIKKAGEIKRVKTQNEKVVLPYIQEGNTVENIICMSRLGEFETCEAIDSLLKRGALNVMAGGKKPQEEKAPMQVLVKKAAGFLIPGLALAVVCLLILFQVSQWDDSMLNRKKEMDYIVKEASHANLDFIFSRLQLFTALYREFPKNLDQLVQTGLLSEEEIYDARGNPVQYFTRGDRFFLYSTGSDGDKTSPAVLFGE